MRFARLVLVALVLAGGVLFAPAARAHTEVQRATPGPGDRVEAPVDSVELVFLDPVLPRVEITVMTSDGDPVAGVGTVTHTDDGRGAAVAFDAIRATGDYVVAYEFVAVDGDAQSEAYRFSVLPADDGEDPGPVGAVVGGVVVVALLAASALAIRRRSAGSRGAA